MKEKNKASLYLWLFGVNFFVSAFTFGGGYVVIPMIRKFFVHKKRLIQEEELLDMAAIAQSSPGAIAVNLSVLAGYRVARIFGAVLSAAASVLPPLILLSVISVCYEGFRDSSSVSAILKGMEAGVAALIVDLVIGMCQSVFREKQLLFKLLVPASFFAGFFCHINVAIIIIVSAGLCVAQVWVKRRGRL